MKIKATKKLLTIAGIKGIKDPNPSGYELPGEWYASLVSMGRPGKLAIHFLHHPTLITIIIPGKSLNKTIPLLPAKVVTFLKRRRYQKLTPFFQLHSEPVIFSTDSKTQLGHMNALKNNIEYHLAYADSSDEIEFERIEDIHFDYLFGGKSFNKKYIWPKEILDDFKLRLNNE